MYSFKDGISSHTRTHLHTLTHTHTLQHHVEENTPIRRVRVRDLSETEELIADFGRRQRNTTPPQDDGAPVERMSSFEYFGVAITDTPTCALHVDTLVEKARQGLHHRRRLVEFRVSPSPQIIRTYYT